MSRDLGGRKLCSFLSERRGASLRGELLVSRGSFCHPQDTLLRGEGMILPASSGVFMSSERKLAGAVSAWWLLEEKRLTFLGRGEERCGCGDCERREGKWHNSIWERRRRRKAWKLFLRVCRCLDSPLPSSTNY